MVVSTIVMSCYVNIYQRLSSYLGSPWSRLRLIQACLDSILCGEGSTHNAQKLLTEVVGGWADFGALIGGICWPIVLILN